MAKQSSYQTALLFRFFSKREALKITTWIVSIVVVTLMVALALSGLFQNDQERQAIAETMRNPAMSALVGQGYGLDNYTDGAMLAHQMLLMTAVVVAIMNILLVVGLTRADEEDGQLEMIRALPVGRLAQTNAALLVMVATNVVLALITAISLASLGIESIDWHGSLLYGVVLGITGIVFGVFTLLAAQLSDNARGTKMLAFAVLGVSFMIRAIGDAGNELLSWFSPLGILLGTEVYVNNYWWPIAVSVILAIIIGFVALRLQQTRDIGAGLIRQKPGKKEASRFLQTPIGLSLRLQRTPLIAWLIGMFLIGASYGSVLGDLEGFFAENEMMVELIGAVEGVSMTEQFLSMLMVVMAVMGTIPALMSLLRIRGEEKKERTEHIIARPISRMKLLMTYLAIAIITSTVMLLTAVVGLAATGLALLDVEVFFSTLLQAMLAYLPAVWIMLGLATVLFGFAPKFTSWIWFYLIYSFFVVYLGELLEMPDWLVNLTPYAHIPELPVESLNWSSLSLITFIALGLYAVGLFGYRRRDLEG